MKANPYPTLSIPLHREAHRYAQQFAAEQETPQKGKQVYLNTLAVCAVCNYLKWLRIPTAIHQSHCWHPGLRAMFDVADLVLPNLGKLECRPLLPGEGALRLPPDFADGRIGCVAVRLSEELDRAELLGFAPATIISDPPNPIPLEQLRSLDALIDELHRQRQQVNLRQWLEGIFQEEWQPIERCLPSLGSMRTTVPPMEADATGRSVSRGKVLHFVNQDNDGALILVVNLAEPSWKKIEIQVRLYPVGEAVFLPPGLQITVLDDSQTPCLETQTREADNWMQLKFSCEPKEEFSLCVTWGQSSITEKFVA